VAAAVATEAPRDDMVRILFHNKKRHLASSHGLIALVEDNKAAHIQHLQHNVADYYVGARVAVASWTQSPRYPASQTMPLVVKKACRPKMMAHVVVMNESDESHENCVAQ
jgi:hypothetical protein